MGLDTPTELFRELRTGRLRRRSLLKATGIGIGATIVGAGTASADGYFDGPTSATYKASTVDPSTVSRTTTEPTQPNGSGEGEGVSQEIPKMAPEATGNANSRGSPAQTEAQSSGFVASDFDGLSALDVRGVVPSDNQIAAGDRVDSDDGYLFQAINSRIAAFDKDGNKLTVDRNGKTVEFEFTLDDWFQNVSDIIYGPNDENEFFEDYIIFDPRARFDADSGRFILACVEADIFITDDNELGINEGAFLLSISSTSDPTDPWVNYRITPELSDGLVDYPELGYDGNAIYLTQNFFDFDGTEFVGYGGVEMVALDKSHATSGARAPANHFTDLRNPDGSLAFTVQPANDEGGGETGYFVNSKFFQGQTLTVWSIENPFSENLTFEHEAIRVEPYSNPPDGAEQPETEEKIDMGDDRILRVAHDGSHLWASHTVDDGRVRWYEIDPIGSGTGFDPSVVQSGNFKRNGRSSFYPAIESDGNNTVFAFNTTNPRNDDNGYVNAEIASIADGQVEASAVFKHGENDYDYVNGEEGEPDIGPQVLRWGDYNGASVDPTDGSFWVVAQYANQVDLGQPEHLEDDFYGTRIANITPD